MFNGRTMTKETQLIAEFSNRSRVRISPENYTKRVRLFLYAGIALIFLFDLYLLLSSRLTFLNLGVIASSIILGAGVYFFCSLKIKSTVVKGDTLIVKSLSQKNKVASLRSIKNVRTKSLMGIQWTNLKFSLDGRNESILFFGKSSQLPISPEVAIREAVKMSKKRKANLKPGPVSAH